MKRRSAIRDMVIIAGGITLIPSCISHSGKVSVALRNIHINAYQEKLLAAIASTIIPKTDTPGAGETGAHLFVLKMVDDCYEKDVQQKFLQGLDQLEKITKKNFGNLFAACSDEQKQQVLNRVENNGDYPPEVFDFYKIMKEKTIEGYLTSKYVLVNLQKYELIPSVKYNGYYPLQNTK